MSELRDITYEKAKGLGRLDLWPMLRVEITSMDEQQIGDVYLSAMRNGSKCANTANSWVAWVLGICDDEPTGQMRMTNVPGLADIDSDYDRDRRDEVIELTAREFGPENVAHIGTYGQYKINSAVQTVLKFRGVDAQSAIDISKDIPFTAKSLEDAVEGNERLAHYLRDHEEDREIIDGIIGAYNSVGMHAAGIVISPEPVHRMIPMACTNKGVVTAVDMNDIEGVGLVKFDFLGLANVTTVAKCLALIKDRRGIEVDLTKIPTTIDDCETEAEQDFLRLCIRKFDRADVDTIFQFETPGFVDVLKQMDVKSFNDLVAIMSLNRPGAKKFISGTYYERFRKKVPDDKGPADPENSPIGTYAENRNNPNSIRAPHPALLPILAETFGIPVYQEQALRIVQTLSGATMAEADTLRRAVGKKKGDLFEKCRVRFIAGCQARNVDETVIRQVWSLLEEFDKYSFNKAHSCAYATLAFWNMYLRQKYTPEWYAAVMTTEFSQGSSKKELTKVQKTKLYSRSKDRKQILLDGTKLGWYMQGAKGNDVEIRKPHVNDSHYRDAAIVDDHTVVLPLCALMNVGGNAENVVANRGHKYENIRDLVVRSQAPPSVLRTLIENHACDGLFRGEYGHEQGVEQLEQVLVEMRESERAAEARMRKSHTQTAAGSMFQGFTPVPSIQLKGAIERDAKRRAEAKAKKKATTQRWD